MTLVQMMSIEDIMSCPVCMDTFNKPKVLPCQHTFCLECLFTAYRDSTDVSPFVVKCPVCRHEHPLRTVSMNADDFDRQFPNHFILLALLEAKERALRQQIKQHEIEVDNCQALIITEETGPSTSGQETEDITRCAFGQCARNNGEHNGFEAKWFCLTCDIPLCSDCGYEHFNRYSAHEIINLDDQKIYFEQVLQNNPDSNRLQNVENNEANTTTVEDATTDWELMWKSYTDMLIISTTCLIKAVIIGAFSSQVLSKSQAPIGRDFLADANELRRICQIFRDIRINSPLTPMVIPSSCLLEGVLYELVAAGENILYGQTPGGGFFAIKTRVSIIIGIYSGHFQEAIAAGAAIQQISEILRESYY